MVLVGVTEGMLPFKLDDDEGRQQKVTDDTLQRLQEERRLMYVGITRAQRTLAVSWTKSARRAAKWCRPSPAASSPKWAWTRPPPAKTRAKSSRPQRAEFAAKESLGRQHPAALKGAAHHGTHPYGTLAHPSPRHAAALLPALF